MIRIGHGYDVHALIDGEGLRLGGVDIPFDRAFQAHSDGDVAIHALCDALLGALALGDIGVRYPDSDPTHANRNSVEFLQEVVGLIHDRNYGIGNVDITVIAQAPKLRPYIDAMRAVLASNLQVSIECVNVKATTTEGLGPMGRKEGIAAHAVALLIKDRT